MSDAAYESFLRVLQNRPRSKVKMIVDGLAGVVFLDKDGRPKTAMHLQNYMRHIQKKFVEKHGNVIPTVTPHVLRHTFCTNMQRKIDVKSQAAPNCIIHDGRYVLISNQNNMRPPVLLRQDRGLLTYKYKI